MARPRTMRKPKTNERNDKMLNDKQRETVRDYFKRFPNATPQDIEMLLGFKMDIATTIETGLLKIEVADEDGSSKRENGTASGKMEVDFRMAGDDHTNDFTCAITVKQVIPSKKDVATILRAYVLKKVILALREEFSRILQDADKMRRIVKDAEDEIKKENSAFVEKEGV